VPPPVLLSLSLVFSLLIIRRIEMPSAIPSQVFIFILFIKELISGFVIGFIASLPFYFIQQSGYLMEFSSRGILTMQVTPSGDEESTVVANLFFFICVLIFFAGGIFHSLLMGIDSSFDAISVYPLQFQFTGKFMEKVFELSVEMTSKLMLASVLLAFPVLLLVLIVDIMMGLIGRFSPYFGGYFVSMPLRGGVGILSVIVVLIVMPPLIEKMMALAMKFLTLFP